MRDCLKLTAYFDERQRSGRRFLADAVLDLCETHGIATSIALRGIGGFGPRRDLRTDRLLSLSEDPPMVVVAVDRAAPIRRLLDPLQALSDRALFTVERLRLPGVGDDPGLSCENTESVKLTVYLGRHERIAGTAGYLALCDLFHRHGFDGAAVLLGVDGIIGGRRARARFFGANVHVPIMVVATAAPGRAQRALEDLSRLPERPLVTAERIRVCKRDGRLLRAPQTITETIMPAETVGPVHDGIAGGGWQKITVHTSEADRHLGEPVHRALIRSLRDEWFASGATALRAVWGFHGAHRPYGDRLLRLGRHVPVATTVIDKPENLAEVFSVINAVTTRHGLVTSEVLPMLFTAGD